MIKELFEGPVGDYCIARNTIKCLFDTPTVCCVVRSSGVTSGGDTLFDTPTVVVLSDRPGLRQMEIGYLIRQLLLCCQIVWGYVRSKYVI